MDGKQPVFLIESRQDWARIQDLLQNAVVQVFVQVGRFNWLEPYKIAEQFENRGSGFLINEDGYFVTNAHVVNEATLIWVHIPILGRQNLRAEVVGQCPGRDLALLRIIPEDLKFVRSQLGNIPFLLFGDSDSVQRTDNVLVLGYPLGQFRLKSTTGVVSGREMGIGQALIQITAPINPGSSGGPLLNAQGQVVGITVASVFEAQNVGYAIPINELKLILDDLYAKKLVRKPLLGVQFVYASDKKAKFLGNPKPAGIYISKVFKNSLMEKAGVQEGDMLYEFDGYVLDAHGETMAPWGRDKTGLGDLIARVKVGETIEVVIYRNGERKELRFTFEITKLNAIRHRYPDYEPIPYEIIAGLVVMELANNHLPFLLPMAPDLVNYVKRENKVQPQLIITHVIPGSQAQQLRALIPGDVILEVNGKSVKTLENFRKIVRKSLQTGFLSFKTKRNVFAVFDIHQILDDEVRLSKDFAYPMSKLVQRLINAKHKKEEVV